MINRQDEPEHDQDWQDFQPFPDPETSVERFRAARLRARQRHARETEIWAKEERMNRSLSEQYESMLVQQKLDCAHMTDSDLAQYRSFPNILDTLRDNLRKRKAAKMSTATQSKQERQSRRSYHFMVSDLSEIDIERVCREQSGADVPPDVFMISSQRLTGLVVGVSLELLLSAPGMPLGDELTGPQWGYNGVEKGALVYQSNTISLFGYRLDNLDRGTGAVDEFIADLARVRAAIANPPAKRKPVRFPVKVTEL